MARGMNKVTIIGFVEREPEMRYAVQGDPVTSFPVSTSRHWTTSNGEARESTEWFNIVAWRGLAEAAKQRLRGNQRVYAEGHLQTRSWEDEEGLRHFRTEVVASNIIFAGSGGGGGGGEGGRTRSDEAFAGPPPADTGSAGGGGYDESDYGPGGGDDDIPF